jgi:hypothetical protein
MKTFIWNLGAACVVGASIHFGLLNRAAGVEGKPQATPDLSETDMSHTGSTSQGTVTVPWDLLGGTVGDRAVNGVRVELYVLQAVDMGKLKPGDPNHAFTVTLKDEKTSAFIKQADVSLRVSPGAPAPGTGMKRNQSGIFRAGVSLPKPGQYKVTVAFHVPGRSGEVEFPYEFRPEAPAAAAHHHH